jgi:hypothetical protein
MGRSDNAGAVTMNLQGQIQGDFFAQLERDTHGFSRRVAEAHTKRAQVLAAEEAPKLTGLLASTIDTEATTGAAGLGRIIGPTRRYAPYVHGGTGLYGPLRRRIRPKLKRALRWVLAGGQAVFARSTAGQKPNPFLDRAFSRLLAESEKLIDRLWGQF